MRTLDGGRRWQWAGFRQRRGKGWAEIKVRVPSPDCTWRPQLGIHGKQGFRLVGEGLVLVVFVNQRMEFRNDEEAIESYCRSLGRSVIYLKYRM